LPKCRDLEGGVAVCGEGAVWAARGVKKCDSAWVYTQGETFHEIYEGWPVRRAYRLPLFGTCLTVGVFGRCAIFLVERALRLPLMCMMLSVLSSAG
jgi:hypothetical protein